MVAPDDCRIETQRHTSGTWSMVAITAKIGLNLARIAWMMACQNRCLLGFDAVAMAVSAIKVGSRKKEKVNRPSELEEILLRCYIKLRPESQESCVYLGIKQLWHGKPMKQNFGIKSFYPKIGGHVFTPKIDRRARDSQASKIVPIKESIT